MGKRSEQSEQGPHAHQEQIKEHISVLLGWLC
jgi:hypothetical protein